MPRKKQTLESFIISKSTAKIADIVLELNESSELLAEIEQFKNYHAKNDKNQIYTRRENVGNIGPLSHNKKKYYEILQSTVEHFELNNVHRPQQTQETNVSQLKLSEIVFKELILSLEDNHKTVLNSIEEEWHATINPLVSQIKSHLAYYQKVYKKHIDVIRRSSRSKLLDVSNRINHEAKKELNDDIVKLFTVHEKTVDAMREELKKLKSSVRRTEYEVSKIIPQVDKLQQTCRRNGLVDLEVIKLAGEKVKLDQLPSFLQDHVDSRRQTIDKYLTCLVYLQKIKEAFLAGVAPEDVSSYILNPALYPSKNPPALVKKAPPEEPIAIKEPIAVVLQPPPVVISPRIPKVMQEDRKVVEMRYMRHIGDINRAHRAKVKAIKQEIKEIDANYSAEYEEMLSTSTIRENKVYHSEVTRSWNRDKTEFCTTPSGKLLNETIKIREKILQKTADAAINCTIEVFSNPTADTK